MNLGDVNAKVVFDRPFVLENKLFGKTSQKGVNGLIVKTKDATIIRVKDNDTIGSKKEAWIDV